MVIYVDLLIILNFFFDFLILSAVNITLKRNAKIISIIIGSLVGELSILFLFFNKYYLIFIAKILFGIIINIVTFKYKNFLYTLNNFLYFFMIGVIIGGFVYLLKINDIPYYLVLLLTPLIVVLYYKEINNIKNNVSNYYKLKIYFSNNIIFECIGYIDTGNKLKDLITNKYVILVNKKLISSEIKNKTPIYVTYRALNHRGIVECYKVLKIEINNKLYTNVLVGVMENEIGIDGVDCILNINLLEEINV